MRQAKFAPRRLGHVNLWVATLDRSIAFYEKVCGIEFVRLEREIRIGFHSNGNTHHDIGMCETSKGFDRYGRNGILQIPKTRGLVPSLNHLGWEMENEAELVDALRRAKESKAPIHRVVDHLISHSVYTSDPDGNGHEFYADEMKDWRKIYNLDDETEVTGDWNPDAQAPKRDANYNVNPSIRRVEGAPLHPSHLTDACLGTRQLSAMRDFFVNVAGLSVVKEEKSLRGAKSVALAGTLGRPDLTLIEVGTGDPIGLRSFSFVLAESIDVAEKVKQLTDKGIRASKSEEVHSGLRIQDPDGFSIDLYSPHARH